MDQPRRRTSDVVVKAVHDEVLIYDLTRNRAHALNSLAAAIWRACDGAQSAPTIAAALQQPEAVVRYGLGALGRANLVTGPLPPPLSRRDLLRRLGPTALLLPLVTSIVAPTAAQAQSGPTVICVGPEDACGAIRQCCAPACSEPPFCICQNGFCSPAIPP